LGDKGTVVLLNAVLTSLLPRAFGQTARVVSNDYAFMVVAEVEHKAAQSTVMQDIARRFP
jgi:hypothetical protein